MLFTWDTTNLCIVFPSWRVTGTLSLIVSLLAVVALTAGYEAIREVSRRYEERQDAKVREAPRKFSFLFCYLLAPPVPWNSNGSGIVHEEVCRSVCLSCGQRHTSKAFCLRITLSRGTKDDVERSSLLAAGNAVAAEEKKGKTVKAALYGVQVFYSFFIM